MTSHHVLPLTLEPILHRGNIRLLQHTMTTHLRRLTIQAVGILPLTWIALVARHPKRLPLTHSRAKAIAARVSLVEVGATVTQNVHNSMIVVRTSRYTALTPQLEQLPRQQLLVPLPQKLGPRAQMWSWVFRARPQWTHLRPRPGITHLHLSQQILARDLLTRAGITPHLMLTSRPLKIRPPVAEPVKASAEKGDLAPMDAIVTMDADQIAALTRKRFAQRKACSARLPPRRSRQQRGRVAAF